jgi:hypothetical protein
MDAPIAVAHPRLAKLLDPSFQRGLPGAAGFVMVSRGIENFSALQARLIDIPQSASISSTSLRFRAGLSFFGG